MLRHLPQPRHAGVLHRGIGFEVRDHAPSTCLNQRSAASPSLRVTSSTVRLWRMPLRSSASWSNRLTSVSLFGNRGWNSEASALLVTVSWSSRRSAYSSLPRASRSGWRRAPGSFWPPPEAARRSSGARGAGASLRHRQSALPISPRSASSTASTCASSSRS